MRHIKSSLAVMKIAIKARRHKGTPRCLLFIKKTLAPWCAVSWWKSLIKLFQMGRRPNHLARPWIYHLNSPPNPNDKNRENIK
jgi:hypothetical protein